MKEKGFHRIFDLRARKGLGMKIIDVLAQQLGGSVSVTMLDGRGAGVAVTFPRAASFKTA